MEKIRILGNSIRIANLAIREPQGVQGLTRRFGQFAVETSTRCIIDLLGFRLSDRITCEFYGYPVDLGFFHAPSSPGAPSRHHTVAFGGPQRKRLHHFMIEVGELEDVGKAYDRAIRAGVPIMQTLGRHPNDRMLSFYALTPSKFQFEFGWGGRLVDDDDWSPTVYDRISDWGHHPPAVVAPRRKK